MEQSEFELLTRILVMAISAFRARCELCYAPSELGVSHAVKPGRGSQRSLCWAF